MNRIRNVRNTTKFKRSVKAISPVIATLLMIAIAVVASLVVYAWVTGYIGGTTSTAGKSIQIQSFASDPTTGNLIIYVQNVGQGDVELNQGQSVYVDSNLVSITTPNEAKIPIAVGETVALLTDHLYTAGTKVTIKVTTTDGTFMTTTGTGSSGGGGSGSNVASITLDQTSGNAGSTVTLSGSNFAVTSAIAVKFDTTTLATTPATVTTTAAGAIPSGVTFTVPASASTGSHTITVTDASSNSATSTFTVTTVQYTITVTQSSNGMIAPGTSSYGAGSTPSFTITPNSGYHIASVTTNAGAQALTSPYVFPALSADGTLTATFAADVVGATKLVFSAGASQTLTAGVVSPTAIVIQRQDGSNNPVSTGAPAITITLTTSSAGGAFYSNSGGTVVITTITIPAGASSSANFYYKDTVAASPTLTGVYSGLTSATSQFTINAAVASKLVFIAPVPTTVVHNVVSAPFTVQRQDQYGNPVSAGASAITVSLSSTGGTRGHFYTDAGGSNEVTQITISAGSSSANFYYKDTTSSPPQTRTITASSGTLTSATSSMNVT